MSRTRTRNGSYNNGGIQNITGTRYNGASPATQISASTSYEADTWSESTSDTVTPGFKSKIAHGGIVNNPYTHYKIIYGLPKPTAYNRTLLSKNAQGQISGDMWNGSWPMSKTDLGEFIVPSQSYEFNSLVSSLKSQAITQAYANTDTSEMMILATAAEMEKTAASIVAALVKAHALFKAARRYDVRFLKREIKRKELANRYMELRYAVRPLVYDVKNSMKALQKGTSRGTRHTGRGVATETWTDHDTFTRNDGNFIMTIKRDASVVTTVRAGVLCSVDITQASIWGIDQILESAWELVPMSFIADWFLNIGTTLAAWTPNIGVKQLASWCVVEHATSLVNSLASIQNASNPNYASGITWSGSRSQTELWKIREVDVPLGILPQLNVRLDLFKLLDLGKIIAQLRK